MNAKLVTATKAILILLLVSSASAQYDWIQSMKTLAYALGWLMMVIMGVKWIIADSPNERADAKKGMIYIVIGLLIVRSSCQILQLYCDNAHKAVGTNVCKDMASMGC